MPVKKVKGGYRWGTKGKAYASKEKQSGREKQSKQTERKTWEDQSLIIQKTIKYTFYATAVRWKCLNTCLATRD